MLIISDLKLSQIKKMETNSGRFNEFVDNFILDIPWDEHQNEMLELEKITNKILLISHDKLFG